MALRRIEVSDFRCLHSAGFDLDPAFTLISGPNAAGKTSVLEAIHVLGRGRSFRTRRLDTLIATGAERFIIFGEVCKAERRIGLGVEGSLQGMKARLGGDRVASLTELAAVLPVQIIDPEVHRLIEEGPARRRRFLDWGVFHVEQGFVEQWQRYQSALRQRNAALKARQSRAAVAAWDGELVRAGEFIQRARSQYLGHFEGAAKDICRALLGMDLSLSYRGGWPREMTLAEALVRHWPADLDTGRTQFGPHRAEVGIRLDGVPVKDRISRGQQKLLAAALLMAQLCQFPEEGAQPTLLLDDPAAELDGDRLLGLIREVSRRAVQLVVTSLTPNFTAFGAPGRHYGINAGMVKPL